MVKLGQRVGVKGKGGKEGWRMDVFSQLMVLFLPPRPICLLVILSFPPLVACCHVQIEARHVCCE